MSGMRVCVVRTLPSAPLVRGIPPNVGRHGTVSDLNSSLVSYCRLLLLLYHHVCAWCAGVAAAQLLD